MTSWIITMTYFGPWNMVPMTIGLKDCGLSIIRPTDSVCDTWVNGAITKPSES